MGVLGIAAAAIGLLRGSMVLLSVGGALLAVALLSPGLSRPLASAWGSLGRALGRVNTVLILGGVYLLVLTPLALVRRLLGQGDRRFRSTRRERSTWEVRNHRIVRGDLDRPW